MPLLPDAAAGLMAFAICAGTLPLLKSIAARWRLYDQPGELKIHREPVARIGGAAMMVGVVACVAPAAMGSWDRYGLFLVAIVAVWAVGFADDLKSLSVIFRFGIQCAAAALLWTAGWRLQWSGLPSLDFALTTLFVVFVINAMNWLDGMDGLAAGTTAIAAAGFLWLPMDPFSKVVTWALLGVCLGMLLVNFPPATVFMGDSGSMLIGVLVAFLCLDWVRINANGHSIVSPLFFIALPLADGVFAIVRRLRTRRSPFLGDRRHFYDLLAQRGWPAYRVMLVSMLATCAMVALGKWSQEPAARQAVILLGIAFLLLVAYLLGSLRPDPARSDARKQTAPVTSIGMTLRRITHS